MTLAEHSLSPSPAALPLTRIEQLRFAEQVLQSYALALANLSRRLDGAFAQAATALFQCRGCVLTTGMGKAGWIAQKVSATLASTGTRSHFLHPAEAMHGDLGRLAEDDLVLAFSQSGETAEVVHLLPSLAQMGVRLAAITGHPHSTLGRKADIVVNLGALPEACPLGLAPSTSTMAMLAVGDALALVVSRMRGFQAEDFARYHPGGNLGRQLSLVNHYMRPLEYCRVSRESCTVRDVLIAQQRPGRRSGAVMLLDDNGRLSGLFTDSDLARLFEQRNEAALDRPIAEVMTRRPTTVQSGARFRDALHLLADCKFSELPVVDADGRPVGLLDVTDVVGLAGQAETVQSGTGRAAGPSAHGLAGERKAG